MSKNIFETYTREDLIEAIEYGANNIKLLQEERDRLQEELEKADRITQSCIYEGRQQSDISFRQALNKVDELKQENKHLKDLQQNMDKQYEKLENNWNELKDSIEEILSMVCTIEHNLEKYEEVGLDHFDYALKKTWELKDYVIETLGGNNGK